MTAVTSGSSIFFSHHTDPQCEGPSYAISAPRNSGGSKMKINICSSDLAEGGSKVKLQCKLGANTYSIVQKSYASTDALCSTAISSKQVLAMHGSQCQPTEQGGYAKIHCGEDSSPLLTKTSVVSPALFRDKACMSTRKGLIGPISRRAQLKVCTPHYYRLSSLRPTPDFSIDYYYVLTIASASDSPSLSLKVERYDKNDERCTGRVIGLSSKSYAPVPITAPAAPQCIEDPLHPNLYYRLEPGKAPYVYSGPTSQPTPAPLPASAESLIIRADYGTDATCTTPTHFNVYRTLGKCIKEMGMSNVEDSLGTVPRAGSRITTVSGTTATDRKFHNDFCTGTPYSVSASQMDLTYGVCVNSGGSMGYFKSWITDTFPQPFLSLSGRCALSYLSDGAKCADGKDWASAFCTASSACDLYGNTGGDWGNPSYRNGGSCSSDHLTTTSPFYGEATCTSKTSTATFYGDTDGAASNTLTIRNAVCVNPEDGNNQCTESNGWFKAISSTGVGAAGYILEGMTLSWSGKTGSDVVQLLTESNGQGCSFDYMNNGAAPATCALNGIVTVSCTIVQESATVTTASASSITVGSTVTGLGISASTVTVVAVDTTANTITLSSSAVLSTTTPLTFTKTVNIPSNTLITGTLVQSRPDDVQVSSGTCDENEEQWWSGDKAGDANFYSREYCGVAGVSLMNLPATTLGAAGLDTTRAAGTLVIKSYSDSSCTPTLSVTITGTTTSGSTSVTLTSASSTIVVGSSVSGTGIASGTTVTDVSGTTVTLSTAATATSTSVSLTFAKANIVNVVSTAMGICVVQNSDDGLPTGGSYMQLLGSLTIETRYFANPTCSGTAGRTMLQTIRAYTGLGVLGAPTENGGIGACVSSQNSGNPYSGSYVKVTVEGPA